MEGHRVVSVAQSHQSGRLPEHHVMPNSSTQLHLLDCNLQRVCQDSCAVPDLLSPANKPLMIRIIQLYQCFCQGPYQCPNPYQCLPCKTRRVKILYYSGSMLLSREQCNSMQCVVLVMLIARRERHGTCWSTAYGLKLRTSLKWPLQVQTAVATHLMLSACHVHKNLCDTQNDKMQNSAVQSCCNKLARPDGTCHVLLLIMHQTEEPKQCLMFHTPVHLTIGTSTQLGSSTLLSPVDIQPSAQTELLPLTLLARAAPVVAVL